MIQLTKKQEKLCQQYLIEQMEDYRLTILVLKEAHFSKIYQERLSLLLVLFMEIIDLVSQKNTMNRVPVVAVFTICTKIMK